MNASEDPTPHAVGKINKLLLSSVKYFEEFVQSFMEVTWVPRSYPILAISEDYLRPILCAKLQIARLHSKVISPDPTVQVSIALIVVLPQAHSQLFNVARFKARNGPGNEVTFINSRS